MLIKWIKEKATWLITIVTLLVNAYALHQSSEAINLSRKTLELSFEPSIEFQLYPEASYIINTSNQVLQEICIFPITYVFDPSLSDVKIRNQPMGSENVQDLLEPNGKIKLGLSALAPLTEDIYSLENINVFRALVVTFRRQQDNRKFKALHIFQVSKIEDNLMIVSLGSGHLSGSWSGPPQMYMNVIKKINDIEKTMFNVESFK